MVYMNINALAAVMSEMKGRQRRQAGPSLAITPLLVQTSFRYRRPFPQFFALFIM
jgi:hypothetical protein